MSATGRGAKRRKKANSASVAVGDRFGMLVVISITGARSRDTAECRCDCGTAKRVRVGNLVMKTGTRSCGCLVISTARELLTKHGHSRTDEYRVWRHMRSRCEKPKDKDWPNYGGRGICVCERWQTFPPFLSDMGLRPSDRHTIERIDNDGNYEPGNVRWALAEEQSSNRRNNRRVTINKVTKTIAEWARETGIARSLIRARLERGWSAIDAVSKPARAHVRHP